MKRKDELKEWMPKDPVARTRKRLTELGIQLADFDQIEKEIRVELDEAIRFACESPYPDQKEILEHVFSSPKERAQ